MARHQELLTDKELGTFEDAINKQGKDLRNAFGEDLSGALDDSWKRPVVDGSE